MGTSVIIPFAAGEADAAAALARTFAQQAEVICAGPVALDAPGVSLQVEGRGRQLRAALEKVRAEVVAVIEPGHPGHTLEPLTRPIAEGLADATYAQAKNGASAALAKLASFAADADVPDPFVSARAFRTEALRSLELRSEGDELDAELLVKLAAKAFRIVAVESDAAKASLKGSLARARTLWRYAKGENALESAHEGYNTLARMDSGAPNYNAWIARRFQEHLGRRVIEIGAGLGTISRQLAPHCDRLIALEADRFYYDRLVNLFRGSPNVTPLYAPVERTDWDALAKERLDTVVLSNVLEHIEDDAGAVRNFHKVLVPGGRLLVLVPALPALFGAMDEAVGHFRRYTPETLQRAFEAGGFTLERLEWMNLVGIPGWFVNGRLFKRRAMPPLQLRLYDRVAPLLAQAESHLKLPVGMSLFAVGRA